MRFIVATWNINSVRLQLPLVKRFLKRYAPDVLCLQETKCPDDQFPREQFAEIIASRTHAKRLPTLTEMANVAAFAASDEASAMTGTIVNLSLGNLDD